MALQSFNYRNRLLSVHIYLSHRLNVPFSCTPVFSLSLASSLSFFQPVRAAKHSVASSEETEVDVGALTMLQSAFRGHIARCSLVVARWVIHTQKRFKKLMYASKPCVIQHYVCALAQSSLRLLQWKTVYPCWQEELAQNTHPAKQVSFTCTFCNQIWLRVYEQNKAKTNIWCICRKATNRKQMHNNIIYDSGVILVQYTSWWHYSTRPQTS